MCRKNQKNCKLLPGIEKKNNLKPIQLPVMFFPQRMMKSLYYAIEMLMLNLFKTLK